MDLKDHIRAIPDFPKPGILFYDIATLLSHADLLERHFNSLTAENEMKWLLIEPTRGKFEFDAADKMVAFAQQQGMAVRGHTLVWHNQTPGWVFEGGREDLLAAMRSHIETVVGRYRGKIYCWDVVNEAVADDGSDILRRSQWLERVGEDYIAEAFLLAHQVDPGAQLYYNDYNETNPEKRDKIYRLVKGLREQGVPVHGIGLQGHWRLDTPSAADIRAALDLYASLGVRLQVTELDVSLYDWNDRSVDRMVPDPDRIARQGDRYAEIFAIFKEYQTAIDGVTFWGIADDETWLDNFPVRARKDWPLLFDQSHQPKPAFWGVNGSR
jgi:endo-1,4-beta-xylanase